MGNSIFHAQELDFEYVNSPIWYTSKPKPCFRLREMGQRLDVLLGKGFRASKCKNLLNLAISRLALLKNKSEIQCKKFQKDVAQLLQNGQEASARSQVEHVFKEQNMVDAYLLIEGFCTTVIDKMVSIEKQKTCPSDLKEAIASLCFAAQKCADWPELQQIRTLFAAKYGREFTTASSELCPDSGVNKLIIEKLSTRAPNAEIKLKLMKEIAVQNGIEWKCKNFLDGPNSFQAASEIDLQSVPIARVGSVPKIAKDTIEPNTRPMQSQTVAQPASAVYSSPRSPPTPFLDAGPQDKKLLLISAKKRYEKLPTGENYDPHPLLSPPFPSKKESVGSPRPTRDLDSASSEDELYPRPSMEGKTIYHTQTISQCRDFPTSNDFCSSAKLSRIDGFYAGSEKMRYMDVASAAQEAFKSAARAATAARVALSIARSESSKYLSQTTDDTSEVSSESDDELDEAFGDAFQYALDKQRSEQTHRKSIHGFGRDVDEIISVRSDTLKGRNRRSQNEDSATRSSPFSRFNRPQFRGYDESHKCIYLLNRRKFENQENIHGTEGSRYRSISHMRIRPGMGFQNECESQRSSSASRLSRLTWNRDFVWSDDSERIKFKDCTQTPRRTRSQLADDDVKSEPRQDIVNKHSVSQNSDNGVYRHEGVGKLGWQSRNMQEQHVSVQGRRTQNSGEDGRVFLCASKNGKVFNLSGEHSTGLIRDHSVGDQGKKMYSTIKNVVNSSETDNQECSRIDVTRLPKSLRSGRLVQNDPHELIPTLPNSFLYASNPALAATTM
eukprot:Gb_14953 [translate_table: standard]